MNVNRKIGVLVLVTAILLSSSAPALAQTTTSTPTPTSTATSTATAGNTSTVSQTLASSDNTTQSVEQLTQISLSDPGPGFSVEYTAQSDVNVSEVYFYAQNSSISDGKITVDAGTSSLTAVLNNTNKRSAVDYAVTSDANTSSVDLTISSSISTSDTRAYIVEFGDGSYLVIDDTSGFSNLAVERYQETTAQTSLTVSPQNATVGESVLLEAKYNEPDPQDPKFSSIRWTQPDSDSVSFSRQIVDLAPQQSGEYTAELLDSEGNVVESKIVVAESESGTIVVGNTSAADISMQKVIAGTVVLVIVVFAVTRIDL